ncbi:hypothetical protein C0Z17_04155 [Trinickia caryophylli]|nr:hypothetical protein C0Z17_04155 [Trinickia caryophylli]
MSPIDQMRRRRIPLVRGAGADRAAGLCDGCSEHKRATSLTQWISHSMRAIIDKERAIIARSSG